MLVENFVEGRNHKRREYGKTLSATVARVVDGDTVKLADGTNVRLYGVDAPETHPREQAFGTEATEFVQSLLREHDNKVILVTRGQDKYKRTIGSLYAGGNVDISLELIKKGLGWAYRQYLDDPEVREKYTTAEGIAKSRKLGLWSDLDPVNPAIFRKSNRKSKNSDSTFVGSRHFLETNDADRLPPLTDRQPLEEQDASEKWCMCFYFF